MGPGAASSGQTAACGKQTVMGDEQSLPLSRVNEMMLSLLFISLLGRLFPGVEVPKWTHSSLQGILQEASIGH